MTKISQTLLLATCAGICFVIEALIVQVIYGGASINRIIEQIFIWQSTVYKFGFFLLGFFPCLIFGTPCLYLIDKYFSRFKTRYITGGFVAGWIAWFFMVGPLFTPSPWLSAESWVLDGINYVGLYVGLGFCTGLLFTALLWISEKLKSEKNPTS